jgi:EAL domain-containing protein (putative c-di-GMP-specific phosphodiesterase class I)
MIQSIEEFFAEVPTIIWEIEVREGEWFFTRRYGEYQPEHRRHVVGKSLSEILPKGHPVVQTILKGIESKTCFTFIDVTTPGRLYQNRCKPILDNLGNVRRVIGVSLDITESLSSQISLLGEATQTLDAVKTELNRSIQEIINRPHFFEHFYLVYQPIINLKKEYNTPGWICGVEALIRLKVEERIITPDYFLPSIQKNGLSFSLACWVISNACQEIGSIARQNSDFYLSINMSIEDLLNTEVFAALETTLTQGNFPASSLHLEILEIPDQINLEENPAILDVIYYLRNLGVKITIDDFGKQSSNFDRLALLAVDDLLKIDRGFIPDRIYGQQASICTAIVWVGKVFQLRLIAEGIETPEQANFMKTIGCDYGQGYFFYQPMDLESLRAII